MLAAVCEDDSARGIHKQTAIGIQTVVTYIIERAALRTNTRYEQEVVWRHLAHTLKQLALRSTHYIHHAVGTRAPLLRGLEHVFEEAFTFCILQHLEIVRAGVAGQCQEHHPFVLILQERRHAVLTHIRCHSERIGRMFTLEHSPRIE